jgi:hypothetical protein
MNKSWHQIEKEDTKLDGKFPVKLAELFVFAPLTLIQFPNFLFITLTLIENSQISPDTPRDPPNSTPSKKNLPPNESSSKKK